MREKYGKEDRINNIHIKLMGENFKKSDVKKVLEADAEYIKEVLLSGGNVDINGIGTLKVVTANARPERMGVNPSTSEAIKISAKPSYSKIRFKASNLIAKELRQKTSGNPF